MCQFNLNIYCFYAIVVSVGLHALWCEVFVIQMDMNVAGTGLANLLSQSLSFWLCVLFTNCQSEQGLVQANSIWPDSRVFNDIWDHIKVGLTLSVTYALDCWVFDLMCLIAGYLGVMEQATTILIMNIILVIYMFAFGLEIASCTLIGNQVGKGDVDMALKFNASMRKVSTVSIALSCVLIYFTKEALVDLLTQNESLRASAKEYVWMICLSMFPDMYKGMLKGVIKALSLQKQ